MMQPLRVVRSAADTVTGKLVRRRRLASTPMRVAYRPQPLQRWDP
jgi:hypothetical protein